MQKLNIEMEKERLGFRIWDLEKTEKQLITLMTQILKKEIATDKHGWTQI